MTFRHSSPLLAAALGLGLLSPAAAQSKPTIAIMPTQYFSADAESAKNLTTGLGQQFEGQGYTVVGADRSDQTFQSLGLSPTTHYADATALKFGRSIGADLVAYPRLLALGIPMANTTGSQSGGMLEPQAVVLLRVLNVHTGGAIYARQIGHSFVTDQPVENVSDFHLPQPVATATATDATSWYFQRVAGSRQEFSHGAAMPTRRGRRHHRRMQ
jgi:hypothetical protein